MQNGVRNHTSWWWKFDINLDCFSWPPLNILLATTYFFLQLLFRQGVSYVIFLDTMRTYLFTWAGHLLKFPEGLMLYLHIRRPSTTVITLFITPRSVSIYLAFFCDAPWEILEFGSYCTHSNNIILVFSTESPKLQICRSILENNGVPFLENITSYSYK